MDSLTVTREEFRLDKGNELEFLAQALGNVSGTYTTETVSPTAVVLQGTPTIADGAIPANGDDSNRIPSTSWVLANAPGAPTDEPQNPNVGDLWVDITDPDNPILNIWNGTEWEPVSGGGSATVHVGDDPPTDPAPAQGDLWWNSADGRMYVFYVDTDSSQWVDASPDAGALTPGTNPPDNPNNGDIWVDTSQCPPVLNIWSDCSGTGEWNPAGGALVAPEINNVTLGDGQGGAGRFTGATFQVAATMTQEGSPESDRRLRIVLTEGANFRGMPRAITRPSTEEITNVETVPFSDGLTVGSVNDSGWTGLCWAGPPWNCYVLLAQSSTGDRIATSTDGREWQLHGSSGLNTYNQDIVYCPQTQKLYTAGYRSVTACSDWDFDFNESWQLPIQNNDSSGWGYLYYDESDQAFWSIWTHWNNPAWGKSTPGNFDLQASNWTVRGGPGNYLSKIRPTNGGLTCVAGGNHPSSPQCGWIANPTSSSWSNQNVQTQVSSGSPTLHLGVSDEWCFVSQNTLYKGTGANPPTTGWTGTPLTDIDPGITSSSILDGIYIADLGLFVWCGTSSDATNSNRGTLLTTTDGTNWSVQYTDPITSEYTWNRMLWNSDRQELVLIASAGTVPGGRVAVSDSVYETIDLPRLTFATAGGLDSFSSGMAVDQNDMAASGVIASVDVDNAQMLVKGNTGTWGPANAGHAVLGPDENYDPAYVVIDADGNVQGLSQFDRGFRQMNGQGPWNITFPDTFPSGNAPDDVIPAGSSIRCDLQAVSDADGFVATDEQSSNSVIPT